MLVGIKSRSNYAPGANGSKELWNNLLNSQQQTDKVDTMLERTKNRGNKGRPREGSISEVLKRNPATYPVEVREKFGELVLMRSGGYIYAQIDHKFHSLARIVYSLHNPDYDYTSRKKVYHIDNNPLNNRIENLTRIREEAVGV